MAVGGLRLRSDNTSDPSRFPPTVHASLPADRAYGFRRTETDRGPKAAAPDPPRSDLRFAGFIHQKMILDADAAS